MRLQRSLLGVMVEALVAVYMGLCVCALYTRDSSALYRLARNSRLDVSLTWSRVFGGVYHSKPFRPPPPILQPHTTQPTPNQPTSSTKT